MILTRGIECWYRLSLVQIDIDTVFIEWNSSYALGLTRGFSGIVLKPLGLMRGFELYLDWYWPKSMLGVGNLLQLLGNDDIDRRNITEPQLLKIT